uniref:arrestin domain-containing protein 3 isoform X2 n=1 Tax=Myxine glutinosa TaxID=7769 RepID=UPI00358F08D9
MLLGKVKSLRVAFDGEHGVAASAVFTSGDLVSGRVLLEAAGSVRVRSLRLMARGHARVHWTESRNAGSNTAYTQNYSDELDFFNHREAIIEPGADDEEEDGAVLQPGRHEFAFNFQLPQGPLATSFEGKYGFIRYWVKVELGRPWALVQKVKTEFTVIDQVDIGTPELMAPAGGTKEKTLCCWLCTSGPISLSAKIQRKGYCPGESIPIHAEIENCSSRPIVPKAAIYQTQIFCAKGKQKPVRQLVTNLRGEPVPPGRTDVWNGRLLKIPPVSPSILVCSLIRVQYELLVYLDIPGALQLSLSLPLVVGTVPLHGFGSRTSSVSSQGSFDIHCLRITLPESPEEPPNYAEALRGEEPVAVSAVERCSDEFSGVLIHPMYAYVQEFRFQPPPLYSEGSHWWRTAHQKQSKVLDCG